MPGISEAKLSAAQYQPQPTQPLFLWLAPALGESIGQGMVGTNIVTLLIHPGPVSSCLPCQNWGNNKTPAIPTKTPFQILNGDVITEHSQANRLQACGNSLLSAGKCLFFGGITCVGLLLLLRREFPCGFNERIGERRKGWDVDLSAAGQGITLMLGCGHICVTETGGNSPFSQFQHLKCL